MGELHPCGRSIRLHPSAASRASSTGDADASSSAALGIPPLFPLFSPHIPDSRLHRRSRLVPAPAGD